MAEAKFPAKLIAIFWKDGGRTSMTVHEKTNVLLAYDPVLKYIQRITETTFNGVDVDEKVIYSEQEE